MATFKYRDKTIFYRDEGEGNPVILVHGFAEDGNVWNRVLKKLKENYRVIVPDLPGSGASELIEDVVSIEGYSDVLKALADEVIFKPGNSSGNFCMIGHSMGGYITLAFAEKYPELLNSFGLFHSSAYADSDEKIAIRGKGIEFIRNNGTEPFVKTSVPNLFSEETKREKPELVEELIEIAKHVSPEALINYYKAMIDRPDRTSVLKSFRKPVLFIGGKLDTAVPLNLSLQQFSIPSIAHVHILKNSGHMGMWEEKELSNTFLQNFLNDVKISEL
ncbi:MAG: alpha/beta fold hydrolase [Ginsengibacter sp.]